MKVFTGWFVLFCRSSIEDIFKYLKCNNVYSCCSSTWLHYLLLHLVLTGLLPLPGPPWTLRKHFQREKEFGSLTTCERLHWMARNSQVWSVPHLTSSLFHSFCSQSLPEHSVEIDHCNFYLSINKDYIF